MHALVLLAFPDDPVRHAPGVEILHVEIDKQKPPQARDVTQSDRPRPESSPRREKLPPRAAPEPVARPRAAETRFQRLPPKPERVVPSEQSMPSAPQPAPQPAAEPLAAPAAPVIAEPRARSAPEPRAPTSAAPASSPAYAPQGASDAAAAPRISDARPLSAPVRYRRSAEQGRVTLKVLVDREGRVAKAALEKTSGHPNLDRHALEAVGRWRFEPARKGNEAVEQWLVVNVDY